MFRISFSSHGDRSFNKMPQDIQQRTIQALESLANDAFWYRRVKKLQGTEDQYRFRTGRWRVLFVFQGDGIEILDIFLRKERSDYRRRLF